LQTEVELKKLNYQLTRRIRSLKIYSSPWKLTSPYFWWTSSKCNLFVQISMECWEIANRPTDECRPKVAYLRVKFDPCL